MSYHLVDIQIYYICFCIQTVGMNKFCHYSSMLLLSVGVHDFVSTCIYVFWDWCVGIDLLFRNMFMIHYWALDQIL